jgi:dolichol kinase
MSLILLMPTLQKRSQKLAQTLASRVVRLSPLRWGQIVLSGVTDMTGHIPVRLHLRSDLHLARKAWHLFMGCVMAMIYMGGMSRTTAVVCLGSILGFDLLMETLRLKSPALNEKVVKLWGPLMRSCELHKFSGVPYYLAAAILAIGILPKPIAVLSILYLACGDPLASLFGVLYGDRGPRFQNGKSWIGTSAGILTCMLVTYAFLKGSGMVPGLSEASMLILTLLGGVAGGSAELLPLEIDDNFSIPMVSGFALWFAFILIGV